MSRAKIIRSIMLAVVVLAICITALIAPKRWVKPDPIPEGHLLVSQFTIDSLEAMANAVPDTVFKEKIITDSITKYIVHEKPVPYYIDLPTGEHKYKDSLKMTEDGIDAWVKIMSQGAIDKITWGYKPVYKTLTKEIRVPEPYPIEVLKPTPQRGLMLMGGVGGSQNSAGFSAALMWQQRNGLSYGLETLQFDQRYYMIKVAYKIL